MPLPQSASLLHTLQVAKEVDQHGDIVFVNHKTNYKSILYKTYYVLEYAVINFNVKFVLKTDDDAFINVAPLMHQLHMLCVTQDCQNERIYMGKMAKESEVLLQPGHKWNNIIFHNHTGISLKCLPKPLHDRFNHTVFTDQYNSIKSCLS